MKIKIIATAAVLVLGAGCTLAWAATPAQTIAARQANFKGIGKAFKAIRDELAKTNPSQTVLHGNAITLAQNAARVKGFFPRGTGPEAGVKTAALPVIWTRNADFQATANQLVASANALQAANNPAAVKAAVGRLGGSCKSCHDVFKAKD